MIDEKRRQILRYGLYGVGLLAVGPALYGCRSMTGAHRGTGILGDIGPLGEPDANGVRLPAGFGSRIVARSGQPVAGTLYHWHAAPDGGATFATKDGGWVYVSNSEIHSGGGGVSAVRFDAQGAVVAAYPILRGTHRNCAGGPTPWGSWLSCEEIARGRVWECDPLGQAPAVVHPALGVFNHEAVAVDPVHSRLYLTEDDEQGRFYRFTPQSGSGARSNFSHPGFSRMDLSNGILEAAQVTQGHEGRVVWHRISDPQYNAEPGTRFQAPASTAFNGGEGCWYHAGVIYFATKGDNRVWAFDTRSSDLRVIYHAARHKNPLLTGVDNLMVGQDGELLVAEDGGNMQIIVLTPQGQARPLLQLVGQNQSEITGPALSPDGRRLYFSSQRGETGRSEDGVTYEVYLSAK